MKLAFAGVLRPKIRPTSDLQENKLLGPLNLKSPHVCQHSLLTGGGEDITQEVSS